MKYSVIQKLKAKYKLIKSTVNFANSDELWYKPQFTREQAEEYLRTKQIGIFVVRKSETNKSCHVLSVKVPKYLNIAQVSHYLIMQSKVGYAIKGLNKQFEDIRSLITHCSYMRDMIPIMLNLDYYRSQTETEINKKKTNLFYYLTSTSSLGSTTSSTSDFSEDLNLDFSSMSSLNLCE